MCESQKTPVYKIIVNKVCFRLNKRLNKNNQSAWYMYLWCCGSIYQTTIIMAKIDLSRWLSCVGDENHNSSFIFVIMFIIIIIIMIIFSVFKNSNSFLLVSYFFSLKRF